MNLSGEQSRVPRNLFPEVSRSDKNHLVRWCLWLGLFSNAFKYIWFTWIHRKISIHLIVYPEVVFLHLNQGTALFPPLFRTENEIQGKLLVYFHPFAYRTTLIWSQTFVATFGLTNPIALFLHMLRNRRRVLKPANFDVHGRIDKGCFDTAWILDFLSVSRKSRVN